MSVRLAPRWITAIIIAMSTLTGCTSTNSVDQAEGDSMPKQTITGPFNVTLAPQSPDVGDPIIGRMSLDKEFHGDLQAASTGQMLAVRTAVPGSAGYVAMERVVGTLEGKHGSFVLQHSSAMKRGKPTQSITVVPDSGTDHLEHLAGTMTIDITDGNHFYNFEYWFEPALTEE